MQLNSPETYGHTQRHKTLPKLDIIIKAVTHLVDNNLTKSPEYRENKP